MVVYNNSLKQAHLSIRNAAQHSMLMQSITTALRMSLLATHVKENDTEILSSLVEFLEDILPDELQLEKGIKSIKQPTNEQD